MSHLSTLVASAVGQKAAATILDVLDLDPALTGEAEGPVSRAVFAMALNAVLFHDIMGRVPLGAAYVGERAIGADDPGAASAMRCLSAVADFLEEGGR